jgi:phosphoesterase RecJ-like protein
MGKEVVLVNESGILPRLAWIPGVPTVQASFPSGEWDALIACDCGDGARVGDSLKAAAMNFPLIINIDHHASNDFFGHLNYVVPTACSTAELISDLLEEMKAPWSAEIATCLFAGLSSDTGSFKYSSTNARTFELAKKLVERGASPVAVSQNLYASNSFSSLKLHADALSQMSLVADGKIAKVKVTLEMYAKYGAAREEADPLVEMARDIEGVVVAVLFKEDVGLWRISLRGKGGIVDLSKVAASFGGGGHKAAAAFRWKRDFAELEKKLIEELTKALPAA